jgi:POT family proton-dependent oligopeptide transporter
VTSTAATAPLPRQIPYIIGSEACERFSFYGMRNILQKFLALSLLLYLPEAKREPAATEVFHAFVAGVYLFPLLGGWLSDRYFGKYNTILWFSLIYSLGFGCLSAFPDNRNGFYVGLLLIALGSGGIKPLVASFVGDQFDQSNKHRAKVVFDAFYWIINFGSFFASLLMPIFRRTLDPHVVFAIPGVLMLVATIVFAAGRGRYVVVAPPAADPHSFTRVIRTALLAPGKTRTGLYLAIAGVVTAIGALALVPWFGLLTSLGLSLVMFLGLSIWGTWLQLDRARGTHPDAVVDGVRAVLRVLIAFAFVTPFWSLFDQKATTWVFQADHMDKPSWFDSAQMQLVNPALVMLLIPFNNLVVFPWLRRRGIDLPSLRKMVMGVALAGAAWIVVGVMQLVLDSGQHFSILWQLVPYVLLTTGEVLVSATGLEFAYSQSPLALKGVVMGFWHLCVCIGNVWVLLAHETIQTKGALAEVSKTGLSPVAFLMFFFAFFAFASALAFRFYARRYRMVEHYRAG